ncbi:MAG: ArsC/Spx/MgsR family protein [Flavobacteriaceae bacterium]|nr:ArsC/Spx/MgsR family protein [Flavobacteriaceae bacterium]
MNLTIYHNPRCRKSREALKYLDKLKLNYKLVKYLESPLNSDQIKEILSILNISAFELVRKNESLWKNTIKNKKLAEIELINILVKNPKLIERPIIIKGKSGVIGRQIENLISFIN